MDSVFLTYKSSRIHYLKGGAGNRVLLCLHGYGESSGSFAFLETPLSQGFTLIAIDLPFHGKTEWREGPLFLPDDLLAIIDQIRLTIPGAIPGAGRGDGGATAGDRDRGGGNSGGSRGDESLMARQEKMHLIGYSMGGRLALSLLEKIPEKIEKLVLVAPDGVKENIWYWLATQTRFGMGLFRFTMHKPAWFFLLLRLANTFRLVNQSVHKFTARYVDNATVRDELYLRWTTFRRFRPDIREIKRIIRQHKIPVRLLYGQYDRIIRAETGAQFTKGIEDHTRLVVATGGHQLLQPKNLDTLVSLLQN
jgi:pimeloyl-ACP methyl ester carboxylesterase